mmetsp:Transcript_108338/g.302059  ORF Transcript_108338/g.302059 Transcript_108338/m.302059 type:complete len:231 (+) Transcript_108338:117-809(+)
MHGGTQLRHCGAEPSAPEYPRRPRGAIRRALAQAHSELHAAVLLAAPALSATVLQAAAAAPLPPPEATTARAAASAQAEVSSAQLTVAASPTEALAGRLQPSKTQGLMARRAAAACSGAPSGRSAQASCTAARRASKCMWRGPKPHPSNGKCCLGSSASPFCKVAQICAKHRKKESLSQSFAVSGCDCSACCNRNATSIHAACPTPDVCSLSLRSSRSKRTRSHSSLSAK